MYVCELICMHMCLYCMYEFMCIHMYICIHMYCKYACILCVYMHLYIMCEFSFYNIKIKTITHTLYSTLISTGDAVAEEIGVFAEPEVLVWPLSRNDKFAVVASDGVFEFLTSQNVVDIVAQFPGNFRCRYCYIVIRLLLCGSNPIVFIAYAFFVTYL